MEDGIIRLDFAPMEGITTAIYRNAHASVFGGPDRYYAPFLSPTSDHIFTPRELRELLPEHNRGICVIPQILGKNADDFLWAARGLSEMGYREVNLNLGCPSATVTAKGKGSGLLRTPDLLKAMLDSIFSGAEISVSVKTRIGYYRTDEYPALLNLLNGYPFSEIILHPRTRQEMYAGRAHREIYEAFASQCSVPVHYNGDIFTPEDYQAFSNVFPGCPGVMLGRGAAADPAVFRRIRGGQAAKREELKQFHDIVYSGYKDLLGAFNAMRRTKEMWSFLISLFEEDSKLTKTLRRTRSVAEFDDAINRVFDSLPLKGE